MEENKLEVNPWLSIWVKPRDTIRRIVQFDPKYRFLILSFLYGLPMLLHTAQNISLGEDLSYTWIVIGAVLIATFLGMLGIIIASGLLYWTGKWIGGTGTYQAIRSAVAWSNVPNIVTVVIWAVLIFIFRDKLFLDEFQDMQFVGSDMLIVSGALFLEAVAAIWSFIILVKALGEVQGFSAWKGVLNVLIPFFLIGIFLWLVTWLIFLWIKMAGA
jgi:hypothetical protein